MDMRSQLSWGVRLRQASEMKRSPPDLRPILQKTVNELEGVVPAARPAEGSAELTVYELRIKPLREFELAELRRAILWRIGLPYIVPLAVDRVEEDPFIATVFGPGDLLAAVVGSEPHWGGGPSLHELRVRVLALVNRALERLSVVPPAMPPGEAPHAIVPDAHDREWLEPVLRDAQRKLNETAV